MLLSLIAKALWLFVILPILLAIVVMIIAAFVTVLVVNERDDRDE